MSSLSNAPASEVNPGKRGDAGRPDKILVVDDTVATRYAIGRHLVRSGFEVKEAGTGADALRLAKEWRPSLITLDIHLPDLLGFDVARRIKEDPETAHIPILHLTASFVTDKDKVLGLEGGADSYLTHPVDPPVMIATIRALLRLAKADEDLRESEQRFRVLANTLPQMTWMTGLDGRLEFVNERWVDYSGFLPRREEMDFWSPIVHAEDFQGIREAWEKALRTGGNLEAELRMRRRDGSFRWHLVRAVPVENEHGEIMRWIGGCTDIDEKKRLEVAVLAAKEAAESANKAKSQFLANMSHEIRTPLGVILGFSEIGLEHKSCPEELKTVLSTIRRNAIHLASLVEDVLDVSKIEAGRLEIVYRTVTLSGLVGDVRSAVETLAKEKGIRLLLFGKGPLPVSLRTDETRVRQILINLATNALKFTEQGEVSIGFGFETEGRSSKTLTIEVADTGIGIPAEKQSKLFQVFSQVDSSTTRRFGGSGLGLALSRRLAEALGGTLELVYSEENRGSLFRLCLPVAEIDAKDLKSFDEICGKEGAKPEGNPARKGPDFSGLKVLVVEDSEDNQKLITRFLGPTGIEVVIASSGEEGLGIAEERDFDLVLMDIQMPGMDGFETTRRLRETGFDKPIIALTAHALKGDRERCLAAGCTDYLTKPIIKDRVFEVLLRNRR